MDNNTTISWIVFAVSVCGYVSTSVALTSILSVRRERLQWLIGNGRRAAAVLEGLYSTPMGPGGSLSLLGALFLTSAALSGFLIVAASTESYLRWIAWTALGFAAVMAINHLSSRILAAFVGEGIALRISAFVRILAFILWPVLIVEDLVVRKVKDMSLESKDELDESMSSELGISVDTSGERLDEREVMMIKGVVELDKTTAREIMVPRVDMAVAELATPLDQMAIQMVDSGHSRIPIYRDNLDRIEGIAYARDVLSSLSQDAGTRGGSISEVIRPAFFIPESKTLEEVLKEFQEQRINIAIVIDEYGGVSGMVTMEDLLEEIVGEIQDEFEVAGSEIQSISENEFLIDARISLDELNDLFKLSVEGDGFDTVGGLVYHGLGKIPSPGDSVIYDGLKIEVVSTIGRRLKKLRVIRSVE